MRAWHCMTEQTYACGLSILDWRIRYKLQFRITSVVLVIAFIAFDVTWAEGGVPHSWNTYKTGNARLGPSEKKVIDLPSKLGTISSSITGQSAETIINIQDAHSSLPAQYSISALLDRLLSTYNVDFVSLEGGEGTVDTSVIRAIPVKDIRRETAEFMLKQGKLSAGEFFSAISDKKIALYGAESYPLYRANMAAFRKLISVQIDAGDNLAKLTDCFQALKPKIFSAKLMGFTELRDAHREGKISFPDYWKKITGDKLCGSIDTKRSSSLALILKTSDLEKTIDFIKANQERKDLIGTLAKKLGKDDLKGFVKKTVAFKAGDIAQTEFHNYLLETARKAGMEIADFPNLLRFTEYLSLYDSIDIIALYKEIELYENDGITALLRTPEEKELYGVLESVRLVKKLIDANMTPDEFNRLTKSLRFIEGAFIADFIRKNYQKYGLTIGDGFDFESIRTGLSRGMAFYKLAERRNRTMLDHTIREMRRKGLKIGALVTGGFHSEGMAGIAEGKGLSYLVIMPSFEQGKERPYITILTNKKQPYEKLIEEGKYTLANELLFSGHRKESEWYETIFFACARFVVTLPDSDRLNYAALKRKLDEFKADYYRTYARDWDSNGRPKNFIRPARFEAILGLANDDSGITAVPLSDKNIIIGWKIDGRTMNIALTSSGDGEFSFDTASSRETEAFLKKVDGITRTSELTGKGAKKAEELLFDGLSLSGAIAELDRDLAKITDLDLKAIADTFNGMETEDHGPSAYDIVRILKAKGLIKAFPKEWFLNKEIVARVEALGQSIRAYNIPQGRDISGIAATDKGKVTGEAAGNLPYESRNILPSIVAARDANAALMLAQDENPVIRDGSFSIWQGVLIGCLVITLAAIISILVFQIMVTRKIKAAISGLGLTPDYHKIIWLAHKRVNINETALSALPRILGYVILKWNSMFVGNKKPILWKVRRFSAPSNFKPFDQRHIVIGDWHGLRPEKLKHILMAAGFVNAKNELIALDTVLVLLGDEIDRGPSSLQVIQYLDSLQDNVNRGTEYHGCKVIRIIGNHEMMQYEGFIFNNAQLKLWLKNKAVDNDIRAVELLNEINAGAITINDARKAIAQDKKYKSWVDTFKALHTNISSGRMQAAYSYMDAFFVHGLVMQKSPLYQRIHRSGRTSPSDIEGFLNTTLMDLAASTSKSIIPDQELKGRIDLLREAVWKLFRNEEPDKDMPFLQIIGHTTVNEIGAVPDDNPRVIKTNVINQYGRYGFLEISGSNITCLEQTSDMADSAIAFKSFKRALIHAKRAHEIGIVDLEKYVNLHNTFNITNKFYTGVLNQFRIEMEQLERTIIYTFTFRLNEIDQDIEAKSSGDANSQLYNIADNLLFVLENESMDLKAAASLIDSISALYQKNLLRNGFQDRETADLLGKLALAIAERTSTESSPDSESGDDILTTDETDEVIDEQAADSVPAAEKKPSSLFGLVKQYIGKYFAILFIGVFVVSTIYIVGEHLGGFFKSENVTDKSLYSATIFPWMFFSPARIRSNIVTYAKALYHILFVWPRQKFLQRMYAREIRALTSVLSKFNSDDFHIELKMETNELIVATRERAGAQKRIDEFIKGSGSINIIRSNSFNVECLDSKKRRMTLIFSTYKLKDPEAMKFASAWAKYICSDKNYRGSSTIPNFYTSGLIGLQYHKPYQIHDNEVIEKMFPDLKDDLPMEDVIERAFREIEEYESAHEQDAELVGAALDVVMTFKNALKSETLKGKEGLKVIAWRISGQITAYENERKRLKDKVVEFERRKDDLESEINSQGITPNEKARINKEILFCESESRKAKKKYDDRVIYEDMMRQFWYNIANPNGDFNTYMEATLAIDTIKKVTRDTPIILFVDTLTPGHVNYITENYNVQAFVTEKSTTTSHWAIAAKNRNIPVIIAEYAKVIPEGTVRKQKTKQLAEKPLLDSVKEQLLRVRNEIKEKDISSEELDVNQAMALIISDPSCDAEIILRPELATLKVVHDLMLSETAFMRYADELTDKEGTSHVPLGDTGMAVSIYGNADSIKGVSQAFGYFKASGIGLDRTEYLFEDFNIFESDDHSVEYNRPLKNYIESFFKGKHLVRAGPDNKNARDRLKECLSEYFLELSMAATTGPVTARMLDFQPDKKTLIHDMLPGFGVMPKYGLEFYETKLGKDLLLLELEALMEAYLKSDNKNLRILFPMVSDIESVRRLVTAEDSVLKMARSNVLMTFAATHPDISPEEKAHLFKRLRKIQIGIMIETDQAIDNAVELISCDGIDFFSVGTNDLSRYRMGKELYKRGLKNTAEPLSRDNPDHNKYLSKVRRPVLFDIMLLLKITQNINRERTKAGLPLKTLSFCGEMASWYEFLVILVNLVKRYKIDTKLVPISLSMSGTRIPEVNAFLRNIRSSDYGYLQSFLRHRRDRFGEIPIYREASRIVKKVFARIYELPEVTSIIEELKERFGPNADENTLVNPDDAVRTLSTLTLILNKQGHVPAFPIGKPRPKKRAIKQPSLEPAKQTAQPVPHAVQEPERTGTIEKAITFRVVDPAGIHDRPCFGIVKKLTELKKDKKDFKLFVVSRIYKPAETEAELNDPLCKTEMAPVQYSEITDIMSLLAYPVMKDGYIRFRITGDPETFDSFFAFLASMSFDGVQVFEEAKDRDNDMLEIKGTSGQSSGTASWSWLGKWYSPIFHAPIFEELFKVGIPYSLADYSGLSGWFALLLASFSVVFLALHIPNKGGHKGFRKYFIPLVVAGTGIASSLILSGHPYISVVFNMLFHFCANFIVIKYKLNYSPASILNSSFMPSIDTSLCQTYVSSMIKYQILKAFERNDVCAKMHVEKGNIQVIFINEIKKVLGRDIVNLTIRRTSGETRKFNLVLYKPGYNIGGSWSYDEERYGLLAQRILNLFRDFKMPHYEVLLSQFHVTSSAILHVVEQTFLKYIESRPLSVFRTSDTGENTYVDPDRTMTIKPLKGDYESIRNNLGLLAVRFIILKNVTITVFEHGQAVKKHFDQAIVQKIVPEFFSYKVTASSEQFGGMFADAVKNGDIDSAKSLIGRFVKSIRNTLDKGFIDCRLQCENYGIDGSVGEISAFSIRGFKPINGATDDEIAYFIKSLIDIRHMLNKCVNRSLSTLHNSKKTAASDELDRYYLDIVSQVLSTESLKFDIECNLREIDIDEKTRSLLESGAVDSLKGLSNGDQSQFVYYVGPPVIQQEAVNDIAAYLKSLDIDLTALEKRFAEIGFAEIANDYRRARAVKKPYLPENIMYLNSPALPYVGVKLRELIGYPTADDVISNKMYRGEPLSRFEEMSKATVEKIRRDIVRILIRFYKPEKCAYETVAAMFGLEPGIDISDRLELDKQLTRIEAIIREKPDVLSAENLKILKNIGLINDNIHVDSKCIKSCFDQLCENRRYPFGITLDDFYVIRGKNDAFTVELEGFGWDVRKAREDEIMEDMRKDLKFPYEMQAAVIIDELGFNGADLFFERILAQSANDTLKEFVKNARVKIRAMRAQKELLAVSSDGFGHIDVKLGRFDFAPDTRSITLNEMFRTRPNIVLIDNPERRAIAKSWSYLASQYGENVNIIIAKPEDFFLNDNSDLCISGGMIQKGNEFPYEQFTLPVTVHYLYSIYTIDSKLQSMIAASKVPTEADPKMRLTETDKIRQIEIIRGLQIPTKDVSAVIFDEFDMTYEVVNNALDGLKKIVEDGEKIYVQPCDRTRKEGSFVISSVRDLALSGKIITEILMRNFSRAMLVLRYIPSITIKKDIVAGCKNYDTIQSSELCNDVRVIVTYDRARKKLEVGPIRSYIAREVRKNRSLLHDGIKPMVPEQVKSLVTMEDIKPMPFEYFLNFAMIKGKHLSRKSKTELTQTIKRYARKVAGKMIKDGNLFDIFAVDFIVSANVNKRGVPIPYCIEFGSYFAGEDKFNDEVSTDEKFDVGYGSYRKNHFFVACERAKKYKSEFDMFRTASWSFLGKWCSPFIHAPALEELKVLLPLAAYSAAAVFTGIDPYLNMLGLAVFLAGLGYMYRILHVLNERAPPFAKKDNLFTKIMKIRHEYKTIENTDSALFEKIFWAPLKAENAGYLISIIAAFAAPFIDSSKTLAHASSIVVYSDITLIAYLMATFAHLCINLYVRITHPERGYASISDKGKPDSKIRAKVKYYEVLLKLYTALVAKPKDIANIDSIVSDYMPDAPAKNGTHETNIVSIAKLSRTGHTKEAFEMLRKSLVSQIQINFQQLARELDRHITPKIYFPGRKKGQPFSFRRADGKIVANHQVFQNAYEAALNVVENEFRTVSYARNTRNTVQSIIDAIKGSDVQLGLPGIDELGDDLVIHIKEIEASELPSKQYLQVTLESARDMLSTGRRDKALPILRTALKYLDHIERRSISVMAHFKDKRLEQLREITTKRNADISRLASDINNAVIQNENVYIRNQQNKPLFGSIDFLKESARRSIQPENAAKALGNSYWMHEPDLKRVREAAFGIAGLVSKAHNDRKPEERTDALKTIKGYTDHIVRAAGYSDDVTEFTLLYAGKLFQLLSDPKPINITEARIKAFKESFGEFLSKNEARRKPRAEVYFALFHAFTFIHITGKGRAILKKKHKENTFNAAIDLLRIMEADNFSYLRTDGRNTRGFFAKTQAFLNKVKMRSYKYLKREQKLELIEALILDHSLDEKGGEALKVMAKLLPFKAVLRARENITDELIRAKPRTPKTIKIPVKPMLVGIRGDEQKVSLAIARLSKQFWNIEFMSISDEIPLETGLDKLRERAITSSALECGIIEYTEEVSAANLLSTVSDMVDSLERSMTTKFIKDPSNIKIDNMSGPALAGYVDVLCDTLKIIKPKFVRELGLYQYKFDRISETYQVKPRNEAVTSNMPSAFDRQYMSIRVNDPASIYMAITEHMRNLGKYGTKLIIRISGECKDKMRSHGDIYIALSKMGIEKSLLDKYNIKISSDDFDNVDTIMAEIKTLFGVSQVLPSDVAIGDTRDIAAGGKYDGLVFVKMTQEGLISQLYDVMVQILVNRKITPQNLANVKTLYMVPDRIKGGYYFLFIPVKPANYEEIRLEMERYTAVLQAA